MGPQGFSAYPNKYFVETGSFIGDGIQKAIDAGFPEIHSLEINHEFVHICQNRFYNNPQVHIWLKDSGKQLTEVIETLDALSLYSDL